MPAKTVAHTPDGRYFVVRERLWRATNPALDDETKQWLVHNLMDARREIRNNKGQPEALKIARTAVENAKVALGERGPVWWDDGAPDYNRKMVRNTPYADWFAELSAATALE